MEGVGLSDCSCFQTRFSEFCFGRRGATAVRIIDNDRKLISKVETAVPWLSLLVSIPLSFSLSLSLSYGHWIH